MNNLLYLLLPAAVVALGSEYELLSLAFGRRVVEEHFKDEAEYLYASDRKRESHKRNGVSGQYFACSQSSASSWTYDDLSRAYGDDNVQTVYVSDDKNSNLVCFTVNLKNVQAPATVALDVWTPIPSQLKISPSVTEAINTKNAVDWSGVELEVTFGLGSGKGVGGMSLKSEMTSIMESLHVKGLSAVSSLSSSYSSSSTSALRNALSRVEGVDAKSNQAAFGSDCKFSELKYETGEFYAHVSNLEVMMQSSNAESCLAALISTFAETSECRSATLTAKNKVVNEIVSQFLQQGASTSANDFTHFGLNGNGIVVGVADTGVDEDSCFFRNTDGSKVAKSSYTSPTFDNSKRKVIQYVNYADSDDEVGGHGTHVCGTIAGNDIGSSSQSIYNGLAPAAKIAFYDVGVSGEPYLDIPNLFTYVYPAAYAAGGRIHSNSWGGGLNVYTTSCTESDAYLNSNTEFVALYAAGNSGSSGASTVISPGTGKNVITVGAAGTDHGTGMNTLAYFSSMGPTFDARYGVDVVAQGYSTYSASAAAGQTCSYTSMSGTSMATPAAAGACALIKQYFQDSSFWAANCNSAYINCGSFVPSGSLIKAVLLHSGQNMGGSYVWPGDMQGFGRVQLNQVLQYTGVSNLNLYVNDLTLLSGKAASIPVTVTSNTVALKVTISWMDPVNDLNAVKQLLNDIDLTVTAPNGVVSFGNNKPESDSTNTAEMVFIGTPATGTYNVMITSSPTATNEVVSVVITCLGTVGAVEETTASPVAQPTMTPTQPTANPTARPSHDVSACGYFEMSYSLAGAQYSCSRIGAGGTLSNVFIELDFIGGGASWPADMALAVFNPDDNVGIQVGGYGGFLLNPYLATYTWPLEWKNAASGHYVASVDISSIEVEQNFQLCIANGWSGSPAVANYNGFFILNDCNDCSSVAPSIESTPFPTIEPSAYNNTCDSFDFDLALDGGDIECVMIGSEGYLSGVQMSMNFESTAEEWAADMAIAIVDPDTNSGIQIGGFGFEAFPGLTMLGWPLEWQSTESKFYSAYVEVPTIYVQKHFKLCYANGWLNGNRASYRGEAVLNDLNDCSPRPREFACAPYGAAFTANAMRNYRECSVYACGGDEIIATTLNGNEGHSSGDTFLRLFTDFASKASKQLKANNDAFGTTRSMIRYKVPFEEKCNFYSVHEGCQGLSRCTGRVHVSTYPFYPIYSEKSASVERKMSVKEAPDGVEDSTFASSSVITAVGAIGLVALAALVIVRYSFQRNKVAKSPTTREEI